MSVAFTREGSAETAAQVELPDRPISPHPNLVTASGLGALTNAMRESRTAYDAAQRIEDAAERRRAVALASRDMKYFADRLRTAQFVKGSIWVRPLIQPIRSATAWQRTAKRAP
jgi:hypothetical protein